jgi:hypothetical protein
LKAANISRSIASCKALKLLAPSVICRGVC